jgi:formate hydrogenlyase transcriptional activator
MCPSDSPGQETAAEKSAEPGFAQNLIERLFEFSPDAILVTDNGGVMRAANPRAEELFGYSSNELIGQPSRCWCRRVSAAAIRAIARITAPIPALARWARPSISSACARTAPNSRRHHAQAHADRIRSGSGSFIRDATEQRAAQEALRLNDLRLRSIVESIGEYAIYLLDRDGHVLTWNPGAERIKGYKVDEVLGLHFSRFFTQEDQERGRPAELLRQAAARDRVEEEAWRVRKDGSRFWANVVITAIRDSSGEVTGFAKVTRDLTDRKRAEEALIFQLSGALLANMDARSCWMRSRPASAR